MVNKKEIKNNWKGAGRKKERHNYTSIIKDGKIVIPKIIKNDIGWELLMGWEYISKSKENQYLYTKRTPWNV
jgi:hypothetical protein